MTAYASENHSRAVLGGGWDCPTAALVVITCCHRAPGLWKVSQIIEFESDLRSVGMAMVRARRYRPLCGDGCLGSRLADSMIG